MAKSTSLPPLDEEVALGAYNEALAWAATRMEQLKHDDPSKSKHELTDIVVRELLDQAMTESGGAARGLSAKQIMKDHRQLTQAKRRRQS